jgi:hypothetical protein
MTKKKQGPKSHFTNTPAPAQRELTVYSNGFAVVQEWRKLDLSKGLNQVLIDGMPHTYFANSLMLFEYTGEGDLTVVQRSLRPANLTPDALLSKSVGQDITIRLHSGGGKQSTIKGELLAYSGNKLIVKLANGRTWMGNATDDMELGELPQGLTNNSALDVEVDATTTGVYQAKLLYFAGGLQWNAFHQAVYDEKAGLLRRFNCEVGVLNNSGTVFGQAQLKLLAGDIGMQDAHREVMFMAASAPAGGRAAKSRQQSFESVGEHKLYPVDGKVSLTHGENKEIPLFAATDVPVEQEYYLPYGVARQHGSEDEALEPVSVKLKLVNNAESRLGKPLPAGRVSIFQLDSSGSPQFTGAAQLGHIADGERFELSLGTSGDIKAERCLLSFEEDQPEQKRPEPPRPLRPLGGPDVGKPRNPHDLLRHDVISGEESEEEEKPLYRTEVRAVNIHNFKSDREVSVTVHDEFPAQAEVKVEGEHKFEGKSQTAQFARVTVPSKGKVTLKYTVRYRVR